MCFKRARDKAVRRTMATACHRSSTGDPRQFWPSRQSFAALRSFAEKFDHVARGGARLAEGDPAMGAQGELLPAQHDLLVALDGDEGAVGAVVGEDEFVEASLDLA